MIGVFVTFRADGGVDRDRVLGVAGKAAPSFEGMPGLRSKVFTYDADSSSATNVYVWESEAAARAFFTDELRERVTGLYGVAPEIRFVEIAALVDNGAGVPAGVST
jgi:heme-degrading monooxygenase HmoA